MSLEKDEVLKKAHKILSSYPWISFGFQKDSILSISIDNMPRQNYHVHILLGEFYPSKVKDLIFSSKPSSASNYSSHKPIFICEFLPKSSQELLQKFKLNYIDSYGNIFIKSENFFLHKESLSKPKQSESSLKSLFSPKTSQVLITMLSNYQQEYKVQDLSLEADVSIGLVSKTKKILINNKLAKESMSGTFHLSAPKELVNIWKEHYKRIKFIKKSYYCSYFGSELEKKLCEFSNEIKDIPKDKIVLCSSSAAYRVEPYFKSNSIEMYANSYGLERAIEFFDLKEVRSGANFFILQTDAEQVFFKPYQTDNGIICTNLIQLILDLSTLNDRAIEASEYIERKLYAS